MRKRTKLKHVLRPWLRPLAWPLQAAALAGFWGVCRLLPVAWAGAFGRGLLRSLGPLTPWHEHLCLNLAAVAGEAGRERIDALARAAWGNFGATLAEYPHLGEIVARRPERHIELRIDPAVVAARDQGRPMIFLTAHLGNWEVATMAARSIGVPLSVVYAPQANPLLDRMVQRFRRPLRCGLIANAAGARPLVAEVRAGRSIGMLADLRVDHGEPVPFFGHPTLTTLVPARLAAKFRCPLVPVRVERLDGARFRITAYPPIRPADEAADEQARALSMMARFNQLLESWIREQPEGWQCLKRRWKQHPAPPAARPVAAPLGKERRYGVR